MSIVVWVWIFAVAGAALFFAAGLLAALARRSAAGAIGGAVGVAGPVSLDFAGAERALPSPSPSPSPSWDPAWEPGSDVSEGGGDLPTANLQQDLLQRVLFAEADARSTRLALEEQVSLRQQAEADLAAERERSDAANEAKKAPQDAGGGWGAAARHARTVAPSEGAADAGATARERALEEAAGELRRELVEQQRAHERERGELGARVAELEARLAEAPAPALVASLRHDLAMAREQSRAREASLARLLEENAGRSALLEELAPLRAEQARLKAENSELRLRALRSSAGVRGPAAAPWPALGALPAVGFSASVTAGAALQGLVEDLTRRKRVRAAVVADELGLVVASSGSKGEELAAAGVVIAHAGAQAGQLLPIGRLRRVSVQDEHSLTITVCPLSAPDGDLSLVTLTAEEGVAAPSDAGTGLTRNAS